MSHHLITYIKSLPDTSFDSVKAHFMEKGFRIHHEGSLYMICQDNAKPATDDFVEHTVGTILNKDTHELVCYGFPKTTDLDVTSPVPFKSDIVASEYIDGTLIRAFYDGSIWRLSTNNIINAYNSYWISEKSFGQLFDSCLGDSSNFSKSFLADSLNKNCSYQFIICHPEVHPDAATPKIYHLGTYCNETHKYISHDINVDKPISITVKQPLDTETPFTCDKLIESFNKGYIMYPEDHSDTQTPRFKVLNKEYDLHRKLLGNTPNIYLRYLECLSEGTSEQFKQAYPTLTTYATTVDSCLDKIAKDAYDIYVTKFIKKVPKPFIDFYLRPFIYELHGNYIKTQKPITLAIVKNTFVQYHPKRINFILNGLKMITTGDVVLPKITA